MAQEFSPKINSCLDAVAQFNNHRTSTINEIAHEAFEGKNKDLRALFPEEVFTYEIPEVLAKRVKSALSYYRDYDVDSIKSLIEKEIEGHREFFDLLKLEGDDLKHALNQVDFSKINYFIHNSSAIDLINRPLIQLYLGINYDPKLGLKLRQWALEDLLAVDHQDSSHQLINEAIFFENSTNSRKFLVNEKSKAVTYYLKHNPSREELKELDLTLLENLNSATNITNPLQGSSESKGLIYYVNKNLNVRTAKLDPRDVDNIRSALLQRKLSTDTVAETTLEKTFTHREDISDQILTAALVNLKSLRDHESLPPKVLKYFLELIDSQNPQDLETSAAISKIEKILKQPVLNDNLKIVSGNMLQSMKKIYRGEDLTNNQLATDSHRGWGYRWLRDNDKAFNEPDYLFRHTMESDAIGEGMSRNHNNREYDFNGPKGVFNKQWSELTKRSSKPLIFMQSGSDANNFLYEIAFQFLKRNDQENKLLNSGDIEILYFEGTYGAGHGRMEKRHKRKVSSNYDNDPYLLPSPTYYVWDPKSPEVIEQLKETEEIVLSLIKEKVNNPPNGKPIGAIFLESIVTDTRNAGYFRPDFPKRLKALCDELNILVFSDEIMTMARTGKNFAYEHYDNFSPDYITFGKGAILSGVAEVAGSKFSFTHHDQYITYSVSTELALKGAQVLKRVREDKLVEHARSMEEHYPQGVFSDQSKGLLIYGGRERKLPYLDITPEELKILIDSDR